VDYSLNYAPPTSTKALLPLHYITFCVFPLHSTFLYLVLSPANCSRAWLSPGRATTGYTMAPAGCNLPRQAVVGHRPSVATVWHPRPAVPWRRGWLRPGCTKAMAGRASTIHSWSSLRFIGQLLFWSFVHHQNDYTYETIWVRCKFFVFCLMKHWKVLQQA
jgi:hypothetical protein